MAIIRRNREKEDINVSDSKKVGKANSKDIKKKNKSGIVVDGVVLQLDSTGKPFAPRAARKKEKKDLSSMINEAKKDGANN